MKNDLHIDQLDVAEYPDEQLIKIMGDTTQREDRLAFFHFQKLPPSMRFCMANIKNTDPSNIETFNIDGL